MTYTIIYLASLALLLRWNHLRSKRLADQERIARALQTAVKMENVPEEEW